MKYLESYGPRYRTRPDLGRCAESVFGDYTSHQCQNKAKFDPDESGNPTTCGVHSEARVAAKKTKRDAEYELCLKGLERNAAEGNFAKESCYAIRLIADGHNDPRALANEILDKLKKALEA
jgi:hypothetical protein